MGQKQHQLEGKQFGKWNVLKYHDFKHQSRWECECECGRRDIVGGCNLVNGLTVQCRECGYEVSRKSRLASGIPMTVWHIITNGAKSRGYEVLLTKEEAYDLFLAQEGKCRLTGVQLVFGRGGYRKSEKRTASLDRIDSSLGYVTGNVQWVHKDINMMKQSLSQECFKEWCRLVTEYGCESWARWETGTVASTG